MSYSNVRHDWDVPVVPAAARQIVRRGARRRPSGDAFLNAAKNGPLHVAEYSVLLMHSTEGRCYSTAEIEKYLTGAGFRDVTLRDTAAARGVMTATK